MATTSRVMNYMKKTLMDQSGTGLDLDTDTIKVMLLMVGNNMGSSIAEDFTTLGSGSLVEFDGAGYTGGHAGSDRKEFASDAIAVDEAGNFAWWDVDYVTWTALSVGAANIEGALVYHEAGASEGASKPLFYIKFPSSIAATGGDITMQVNLSGLLKLT